MNKRDSSVLVSGAVERLAEVDALLEAKYCSPEPDLDNKDDPLDEAVYIILSFQTDLARFAATWSRLRSAYSTWSEVAHAPLDEVAGVLRMGGLQRQKARVIQRLLSEVEVLSGTFSLDMLRSMNDEDAERLLVRLPGLSWKGARCILLYSLQRDVFPVDGNTFRILKRTGVLSPGAVYRRRGLHDELQGAVPAHRRRALHVNLVVHGQRICLPRTPQCSRCALVEGCPKIEVPVRAGKEGRGELRP